MPVGNKFATIAPVFTFQAAGSTVILDLAPFTKDLKITQQMKSADATGYGNTNMQYVKTITDFSLDWSTFLETGNVIEDALLPGTTGSMIFGPSGSTAGNRKYTIPAYIENFSPDFKMSDVAVAATSAKPTGNITRGVYP